MDIQKLVKNRFIFTSTLFIALAITTLIIAAFTKYYIVNDNGNYNLYYSFIDNPDSIINEAKIELADEEFYESEELNFNERQIDIYRNKTITINDLYGSYTFATADKTIAEVLYELDIELNPEDRINIPVNEPVTDGETLEILRTVYDEYTISTDIPYDTITRETALLKTGNTYILEDGITGVLETDYLDKYEDGILTESNVVDERIVTNPVDAYALVGSDNPPVPSILEVPSDLVLVDNRPVDYEMLIGAAPATAYSAGPTARTASGRDALPGHVAVNPNDIPYGSELWIVSSDGSYVYGYAIAADTGIALMDGRCTVDLFYDSYIESVLWGKRAVDIYILSYGDNKTYW